MPKVSSALLRASLRACWAALRARAACVIFVTIVRASLGLRLNQSSSQALLTDCTKVLAEELPSLVLVWPSNCGSPSLIEMIAARPSRMSSPVRRSSLVSLIIFLSIAHLFTTPVSAARKPSSWVPPSIVAIVLAKVCTLSAKDLFHCIAISSESFFSVSSSAK